MDFGSKRGKNRSRASMFYEHVLVEWTTVRVLQAARRSELLPAWQPWRYAGMLHQTARETDSAKPFRIYQQTEGILLSSILPRIGAPPAKDLDGVDLQSNKHRQSQLR